MINIRYHIVSITAVFLALGIGTALGSTFLDRYTVSLLDRNIRNAETRIRETKAENQRLTSDLADARARDAALIGSGDQDIVSPRLADVPVIIVLENGVPQKTAEAVRGVLRDGGADVRGTLQVRGSMRFDGTVDAEVAAAVDGDPTRPRAVRTKVLASLHESLLAAGAQPATTTDPGTGNGSTTTTTTSRGGTSTTTGPDSTTTTSPARSTTTTTEAGSPSAPTPPDGRQPEIVSTLLDADYLRFTPGPGHDADEPILEETGYRFVFVSAPGLDPLDDAVLVSLLPAESDAKALPAVVVSESVPEPAADEEPDGTAVNLVRGSALLAGLYSTVDDIETFSGLVATVITLDEVGTVAPGHYGQGTGATSILPPTS